MTHGLSCLSDERMLDHRWLIEHSAANCLSKYKIGDWAVQRDQNRSWCFCISVNLSRQYLSQVKHRLGEVEVVCFFFFLVALALLCGVIEHVVSGGFAVPVLCAVESRGIRCRGSGSEASIVYADGFHMLAKGAAKLSGPAPVTRKLSSAIWNTWKHGTTL